MRPNRTASLVLAGLLAGCSAGAGPSRLPAGPDRPTTDTNKPSGTESASAGIMLQPALIPDRTAQPIRIQLHERRETIGAAFGTVVHELDLDLRGRLVGIGKNDKDAGSINASLVFERIVLTFGVPERPGAMFRYDSASDKPNQGNLLADIMVHVADAELSLEVSPTGELRTLHGLDGRWRRANLLMAPPALLTAQWLFRDVGMGELVGEALFPPMPGKPVRAGDAWEADVPAHISLVTRLNAHVRGEVKRVAATSPQGRDPVVSIEAAGTIEPAPPIVPGETPAIRPTVKTSSVKITQTLSPRSHAFSQHSERTLEVLLTLTPPKGEQREEMTIRQTRTLTCERGGGPLAAQTAPSSGR